MRKRVFGSLLVATALSVPCACTVTTIQAPDGGALTDGTAPASDSSGIDADLDAASAVCTPRAIPASATDTLDATLVGANFGDLDANGAPSSTGWKTVGYDLDGLCTTPTSTDVCARAAGAPKQSQTDGNDGIDNAFGENLLPILHSITPGTFGAGGDLYVKISGGTGALHVVKNGQDAIYPLAHARIVMDGSGGGTLVGLIPTEAYVNEIALEAGRISPSFCSSTALEQIKQSIRQCSDMPQNGANTAGIPCDGISIGGTFKSTGPAITLPAPQPDPCAG